MSDDQVHHEECAWQPGQDELCSCAGRGPVQPTPSASPLGLRAALERLIAEVDSDDETTIVDLDAARTALRMGQDKDAEITRLKGLLHSELLCRLAYCELHEMAYQRPEESPAGCPYCELDMLWKRLESIENQKTPEPDNTDIVPIQPTLDTISLKECPGRGECICDPFSLVACECRLAGRVEARNVALEEAALMVDDLNDQYWSWFIADKIRALRPESEAQPVSRCALSSMQILGNALLNLWRWARKAQCPDGCESPRDFNGCFSHDPDCDFGLALIQAKELLHSLDITNLPQISMDNSDLRNEFTKVVRILLDAEQIINKALFALTPDDTATSILRTHKAPSQAAFDAWLAGNAP